MSESTYLEVKWSISRGYETQGYNICTLVDTTTGKKYRCMGGGYDMTGTVFGHWLADVHQAELVALDDERGPREFYGMRVGDSSQSVRIAVLDGACGFEAMRRVAQAIGLTVTGANRDRNGNARGYLIERPS